MSDIVKTGLWTIEDLGPVFGKVLTVHYRSGTLIITILAILVTFTANRSWKVWRLMLHPLLATVQPRLRSQESLVVQQQQAILRNSETTGGALISFAELVGDRKSGNKMTLRNRVVTLALFLFAILHLVSFLALGILTTQINIGSTIRSVYSTSCGWWLPLEYKSDVGLITGVELLANDTISAENYVRNCYVNESTSISECNQFMQKSIPHFTEMVPCPLQNSALCSASNRQALAMDSGNISFSGLGINWRHAKDVSVRRRSICTPIVTEPFLYSEVATQLYANQSIRGAGQPEQLQAYAYTKNVDGTNMTQAYRRGDRGEYEVSVVSVSDGSYAANALRPLQLFPEFTVVTLRGRGMTFSTPSNDPFFYAQNEQMVTINNHTMRNYVMSRALNSIVCQDMVMICSNITDYCSNWTNPVYPYSNTPYQDKIMGRFSNDTDARAAFKVVASSSMFSTVYYGVNNRGASALQASRHVSSGNQYLLSKDQWKIEVENWFRISMARLQIAPFRIISTPKLDTQRVRNIMNMTNRKSAACSIIKFHFPQYATLSLFGILIIVVLSIVLTILNYVDSLLSLLFLTHVLRCLQYWEGSGYFHILKQNINIYSMFVFYEIITAILMNSYKRGLQRSKSQGDG